MAKTNSPGVRGLTATPRDMRRALEAILGEPGVIGSDTVVSGTSDTSPPVYQIGAAFFATRRTSTDGLNVWSNDAADTVEMPAAPGSGSRIDIIFALHHDDDPPHSDGDYLPVIGVVSGTATGGTPTAPSLPAGAIELGRATVPSGATSTNATTISHTNTTRCNDTGWIYPTLAGGLTAATGYEIAYRVKNGFVQWEGRVAGSSLAAGDNVLLATPIIEAHRPFRNKRVSAENTTLGTRGRVQASTTGVITVAGGDPIGTYLDIGGLSWLLG